MLPTLTDGRLTLRPWQPSDAPVLHQQMQDPETVRWMAIDLPYTIEHAESFIAETGEHWKNRRAAHFAMADSDGQLVGYLGVLSVEDEMRVVELGYWVAASARRRGVATVAVRLGVEWAETELDPERIELGMLAGNEASRRVAEAIGFVMNRTQPSGKRLDGVEVDEWVYLLE